MAACSSHGSAVTLDYSVWHPQSGENALVCIADLLVGFPSSVR